MLLLTAVALISMLVAYAIRNQIREYMLATLLIVAIPLVIFSLFAACYLILLPIGIANAFHQKEDEAESPFAEDRLPDRVA